MAMRIDVFVAAALGTTVSLAPGLLPRTPIAQGLLTGAVVALFVGAAVGFRKILRHNSFGDRRPPVRAVIMIMCVLLTAFAVVRADRWQNMLRAAMGFPDIGAGYWLACAVVTLLVAGGLIWGCRAVRWMILRVVRARKLAPALVAALVLLIALLPAAAQWRYPAGARADATSGTGRIQPISESLSGSENSTTDLATLGTQGRRFMSAPAGGSVRIYGSSDSAPDVNSRVTLVMHELERSGGLTRSNLVVIVPTGSGWVDEHAVRGLAERFGGDVTMVAVQYSDAPSWVGYLFGRRAAEQAQQALFAAIEKRLSTLKHPPRLYIYGQSLGATAGSSIFTDDADQDHRVCAALWAGPPADRVHHAGARILANSSDPVVQWSPELLWRAPNLTDTRTDAPHPPWIPLISFVQTSADLLSALTPGPGHGHRYGTDQGTALGSCGR